MSARDDYADAAEVADLHDEIDKLRAELVGLREQLEAITVENEIMRASLLDNEGVLDWMNKALDAETMAGALREQLARQVQICGERNGTHGTMVCNLPLDHDGDHCQRVAFASWAPVRALSVPAPPEATEVMG